MYNSPKLRSLARAVPTIPLGLVGLGSRPGLWSPEPMAPPPKPPPPGPRPGCGARARATVTDFVSAFRYEPFRWLFVTNVFNQCYGQICGLFFIYWFQDEVGGPGSDFTLLGRHVTSSPRTALALTSTIQTVCGFVFIPPGGWLGDRWPASSHGL